MNTKFDISLFGQTVWEDRYALKDENGKRIEKDISETFRRVAKAIAAKDNNATLFLVPLLQSRDIVYETREHCEKFGFTEICTTEQIPQKINVEEEAGIRVEEVGTVKDALKYFLED